MQRADDDFVDILTDINYRLFGGIHEFLKVAIAAGANIQGDTIGSRGHPLCCCDIERLAAKRIVFIMKMENLIRLRDVKSSQAIPSSKLEDVLDRSWINNRESFPSLYTSVEDSVFGWTCSG